MLFNFLRRTTAAPHGNLAIDAEKLLAQGRYEAARAAFAKELERGDLSAAVRAHLWNRRGVCAARAGEVQSARLDFCEALTQNERSVAALTNLGNLELEAGELEAAVALYERALRIDDRFALAHHHLGVAYRRMGRLRESVRELRRAWWLEVTPLKRPSKTL
ncbi:MAG: tetratricopeptide repeat protein [Vulcanimicrobiaceae bacterium]